MMTPDQAAAGLIPLIGGGGLSAVIVAYIAYLSAARNGRPKTETPVISFGASPAIADREMIDHLATMAYGMMRLVALQELRAEHDLREMSGFRDRLDDKVDRLLIDAMRAWLKKS